MAEDEPQPDEKPRRLPPGEFVSDDLRRQTERFLEEVKRRLRTASAEARPRLGPPKRGGRE
jgi:hypothetical protein